MIDTIYIEVPIQYLKKLDNKSNTVDDKTGEIIYSNGYKGCIKIRQFNDMVRIEASLSKVLFVNNIQSLTFLQMILALKKIEFELGINIREGIIRRLDIEYTFNTKYKPKEYFKYLGNSRYYTRFKTGGTSLYYKNNNREINFYDKIREMKSKRVIIPLEFKGKNIMRFECRYKNTFLRTFAKKNRLSILKISDLINPNIYLKLLKLTFKEYNSINKENELSATLSSISTKKKMIKELASVGIKSLGGAFKVQEMIDIAKTKSSLIPNEYFSRRKAEVRELAKENPFIEKSGIIDEIDYKMQQLYNFKKTNINNKLDNFLNDK